jgi:hypothetical protein
MVDETDELKINIRPSFLFPQNHEASIITPAYQALKIAEEAGELCAEVYKTPDNPTAICREAWDVIQAAEGLLRNYSDVYWKNAFQDVLDRCNKRGDYE